MTSTKKQHESLIEYCKTLLPEECLSRLVNLAYIVMAMIGSTDVHLSSLAEMIGLEATDLSIEQRIRRWLKIQAIDVARWYEPFVRSALQLYGSSVHYVVVDSTQYGPSCRAIVIGLAYAGQVIPLGWEVVKGKKGHTPAQLQAKLLEEISKFLPPGQIVLVGDSEFCSVQLLQTIARWNWRFVVRVKSNILMLDAEGNPFTFAACGIQPKQTQHWRPILWTDSYGFGPLTALATWRKGEDEPLFALSNANDLNAVFLIYSWRFWIEALFADYKGRGFHLAHTKIRDPKRLSRLLMAASIAFLWSLALGSHIFHSPNQRLVDRNDRSDRSFFQLGYRFIKRAWKRAKCARVFFTISPKWFPRPRQFKSFPFFVTFPT